MSLVERVKGMLLAPRTEWPKIAAEPMTAQQVYTHWVMILAGIGAIAIVVGYGSLRFAIAHYLMLLVVTTLIALIVDYLAPRFGGARDFVASLKLTAFSATPALLAGVFHAMGRWGGVLILLASLYGWYTFYLGAPVLRKASHEMAMPFTLVILVTGLALGSLLGFVASGGGFAPRI